MSGGRDEKETRTEPALLRRQAETQLRQPPYHPEAADMCLIVRYYVAQGNTSFVKTNVGIGTK